MIRFFLWCLLLLPAAGFGGRAELNEQENLLALRSPSPSAGMFSAFLSVLGCLHFYDLGQWTGVRVDFEDKGLYYDAGKGRNWWEYYFAPIRLERKKGGALRTAVQRQLHRFHSEAFKRMTAERGHALIQKYIKVRPEIQNKISAFVGHHFRKEPVLGVHFRGTDKKSEAKRVSFKAVFAAIREAAASLGWKEYKIFVATDEEPFIEAISAEFKGKVLYTHAKRSKDGLPVHFGRENQFETGEQALVDCLLLSQTDFLVRTISNLSYCVRFFNPSLQTMTVEAR